MDNKKISKKDWTNILTIMGVIKEDVYKIIVSPYTDHFFYTRFFEESKNNNCFSIDINQKINSLSTYKIEKERIKEWLENFDNDFSLKDPYLFEILNNNSHKTVKEVLNYFKDNFSQKELYDNLTFFLNRPNTNNQLAFIDFWINLHQKNHYPMDSNKLDFIVDQQIKYHTSSYSSSQDLFKSLKLLVFQAQFKHEFCEVTDFVQIHSNNALFYNKAEKYCQSYGIELQKAEINLIKNTSFVHSVSYDFNYYIEKYKIPKDKAQLITTCLVSYLHNNIYGSVNSQDPHIYSVNIDALNLEHKLKIISEKTQEFNDFVPYFLAHKEMFKNINDTMDFIQQNIKSVNLMQKIESTLEPAVNLKKHKL